MTAEGITTEEFLAKEYCTLRLTHFQKLQVRVRRLILEIVQYYLHTFYAFNDEATVICRDIETIKTQKDEELMQDCYKRFLEFLPVRLRSGIQGKNLFKQPTELDLMLSHFCEADLAGMKVENEGFFKRDESGMSIDDHMKLIEYYLAKESEQETGSTLEI